mgnify:CR=1 FL=1
MTYNPNVEDRRWVEFAALVTKHEVPLVEQAIREVLTRSDIDIARRDIDISRRYREGDTVATIARAVGVSSDTILKRLREAGIKIRPRGRPRISLKSSLRAR